MSRITVKFPTRKDARAFAKDAAARYLANEADIMGQIVDTGSFSVEGTEASEIVSNVIAEGQFKYRAKVW